MPREARGRRRRPDRVGVNAAHRDYAEGRLAMGNGRDPEGLGTGGVSESNNMLPHDYGPCQVKFVSPNV